MAEYELQLVDADLVFGTDGEPLFLDDVEVIAQDVANRGLDSGKTVALVGPEGDGVSSALAAVAFQAEEDERVKPGSAIATQAADGSVTVPAETLAGATITSGT